MTQSAKDRALALYEISDDISMVNEIEELFRECPRLITLLDNPTIDEKKKFTIIDRICDEAKMNGISKNFLKTMCKTDEIFEVDQILQSYKDLWDRNHHIIRPELIFSKEPSDDEIKEIVCEIEKRYPESKIEPKVSVDESILGGYIVRIGYFETDMSYEGCFKQLERKLIRR